MWSAGMFIAAGNITLTVHKGLMGSVNKISNRFMNFTLVHRLPLSFKHDSFLQAAYVSEDWTLSKCKVIVIII